MDEVSQADLKARASAVIAGGLTDHELADLAGRLRWLRRCADRLRRLPLDEEEPALIFLPEEPDE